MSRKSHRLADHKTEQERRVRLLLIRKQLPKAFGNFIASLAAWDWFINPITFRNLGPAHERKPVAEIERDGNLVRIEPDPLLRDWAPVSKHHVFSGPPVPDAALAGILAYFSDLQAAAGKPIGWVFGEEFGRLGGRYHCHALVTGVAHLRRDTWWEEAFRRFGRTRIEPFDPERAAAFYTAKYAAKQLGGLHFGGTLAGVDLDRGSNSNEQVHRGVVVARSANLPSKFFRITLSRRHR
jgi:hypothetical protein